MFDFKDDKLPAEQIFNIAKQDGLPPIRVAINANGYRQSVQFWPALFAVNDFEVDSGTLKVIEILANQGIRSKGVVGLRSLYESVRKAKPFDERTEVIQELKDVIIPKLDELGYTCLIGDKIYINPVLIESDTTWLSKVKPLEDDFNIEDCEKTVDEITIKAIDEQIERLKRKKKHLLTGK